MNTRTEIDEGDMWEMGGDEAGRLAGRECEEGRRKEVEGAKRAGKEDDAQKRWDGFGSPGLYNPTEGRVEEAYKRVQRVLAGGF